ncbi:hypothetical protein J7F03_37265 [Streptomyces sp. ISL-43]|uniref:site-specific integrase n=1 Tax=Streptomyces sp. ISL-43 TaxID=2819183 RepID=UPI001BEC6FFF|nr:site-specific integrase [Streptomyces sp. ISL-43]MBT2452598.1 hypothetical protein [Streptomyces sp. ISL-43]
MTVDNDIGLLERTLKSLGRPACDVTPEDYERGVDLVAIQQLLGHWTVSSTMRYVRPSATFIEDAYRRAVATTLGELTGEEPAP